MIVIVSLSFLISNFTIEGQESVIDLSSFNLSESTMEKLSSALDSKYLWSLEKANAMSSSGESWLYFIVKVSLFLVIANRL